MENHRIPLLTFSLLIGVIALYALAPDPAILYFNAADISGGEAWRIVTGHLIHADLEHLLWNSLGLAVLGAIIEYRSRVIWWMALATGIASVSILLMTPFARLDDYCGLSGVLNTMLLAALWLEWQATKSWLIMAAACGSVAKVAVELWLGESIVTHISWPPYAWSHLAGLAGGTLLILVHSRQLPGRPIDKPVGVNQYSALEGVHLNR